MFKVKIINVPFPIPFQGLVTELLSNCDGQLKTEVAQMAAFYEHRLQLGNKAIYHLEAFVAKFMAIYKKFMEDGLDAMMFWFWMDLKYWRFSWKDFNSTCWLPQMCGFDGVLNVYSVRRGGGVNLTQPRMNCDSLTVRRFMPLIAT